MTSLMPLNSSVASLSLVTLVSRRTLQMSVMSHCAMFPVSNIFSSSGKLKLSFPLSKLEASMLWFRHDGWILLNSLLRASRQQSYMHTTTRIKRFLWNEKIRINIGMHIFAWIRGLYIWDGLVIESAECILTKFWYWNFSSQYRAKIQIPLKNNLKISKKTMKNNTFQFPSFYAKFIRRKWESLGSNSLYEQHWLGPKGVWVLFIAFIFVNRFHLFILLKGLFLKEC